MSMPAHISVRVPVSELRTVSFPARVQGPPGMANGGLVVGAVASALSGPVEVTLKKPTPLDRRLSLAREGELTSLRDGEELLATGRGCEPLSPSRFPRVTLAEAQRARDRFAHAGGHPFPGCFVCGTERCAGDGMRVIVGRLASGREVASPVELTPQLCEEACQSLLGSAGLGAWDGRVPEPLLWAALDCPGGWSVMLESDAEPTPMVLGRMSGQILRRPHSGEPLLAVARPRGGSGRKRFCESALFAGDGEMVAYAQSVWIVL